MREDFFGLWMSGHGFGVKFGQGVALTMSSLATSACSNSVVQLILCCLASARATLA